MKRILIFFVAIVLVSGIVVGDPEEKTESSSEGNFEITIHNKPSLEKNLLNFTLRNNYSSPLQITGINIGDNNNISISEVERKRIENIPSIDREREIIVGLVIDSNLSKPDATLIINTKNKGKNSKSFHVEGSIPNNNENTGQKTKNDSSISGDLDSEKDQKKNDKGIIDQIIGYLLYSFVILTIIVVSFSIFYIARKKGMKKVKLRKKKVENFRVNFFDNYGRKIQGVKVNLRKLGSENTGYQTVSDEHLIFKNLDEGTYVLEISKPGYQTVRDKLFIGGSKEDRNYAEHDVILPLQSDSSSYQARPEEDQKFQVEIAVTDEDGNSLDAIIDLGGIKKEGPTAIYNTVPPGDYKVNIFSEGHSEISKTITVNKNLKERFTIPKKLGKLEIQVTTPSGTPVSDAAVQIGSQNIKTDTKGWISTSLKPGQYNIFVNKPMYNANSNRVNVEAEQNKSVRVVLTSSIGISENHSLRIQNALRLIHKSYSEIGGSTYNHTIPKYFLKVGEAVINNIRQEEEKIENYQSEEAFHHAMEDYTKAVEVSFPIISQGMVERRNLNLYSTACSIASQDPPEVTITSSASLDSVKMKLAEIDNRITMETGYLTIHPVTVLWRAAKKILEENPSPYSAVVANIIIEATQMMLDDSTLRQILEVRV